MICVCVTPVLSAKKWSTQKWMIVRAGITVVTVCCIETIQTHTRAIISVNLTKVVSTKICCSPTIVMNSKSIVLGSACFMNASACLARAIYRSVCVTVALPVATTSQSDSKHQSVVPIKISPVIHVLPSYINLILTVNSNISSKIDASAVTR